MKPGALLLPVIFCLPLLAADEYAKPKNLTIHTWVREDLFSAYLANDWDRFEIGVRKLDAHLAANSSDPSAAGWKGYEHLMRAMRAAESGDMDAARKHAAQAEPLRQQVMAAPLPAAVGGWITLGVSYVLSAPSLPADLQPDAYRHGREMLRRVVAVQTPYFSKLPLHHRGELLSVLAFAADNSNDRAARDRFVSQMMDSMPGTPYASRAKRWKSMDKLTGKATVLCLSCHEPGRMQASAPR